MSVSESLGVKMAIMFKHRVHQEWENDVEGGDLYYVAVLKDEKICLAVGRYAQGSSNAEITFDDFFGNDGLQEYIVEKFSSTVLSEVFKTIESVKINGEHGAS